MSKSPRIVIAIAVLAAFVLITAGAVARENDRELTADDLKGLSWRSIGPANMGGRVAALALAPGNSKTFYVGYGTGGVWKTVNRGVTFTPVFDKYDVLSIGALGVADAPADWSGWTDEVAAEDRAEKGKAKIIWVGTGEGNGRNSSSWGGGVYRSTDAGATFDYVGLKETQDIPRLAVDPRNPDVVYIAALGHLWGPNQERGIYKTSDGGATWDHVFSIDENTGACDIVIDPENPDTLYVAMYARRRAPWMFTGNSEQGGIFRTDDGGGSWKKLAGGLPPRTGRIGLAVFAGNTSIVYANVESDFGGQGRDTFDNRSPSGGVFRSEDRGETWTRTSNINPRPFYFSRIAVDPIDDQRVYLPGWNISISDDGGKTFRRSGSEFVHVDFHAIVIDPDDPDTIISGNDGGVYVSYDRADTWDYLNNIAVGQFYRVEVDMSDPYRIGGGLQDNGSWVGPSETLHYTIDSSRDGILNDDWEMIHGGDGFSVDFDPTDPEVVYATSQGGFLVRIRMDNGLRTLLRPSETEGQERLRFNWNAPYFISQYDPTVLYHAGNKVFKLTDRGDKWFAISPDLTRKDRDKVMTAGSDAETYGTVTSLAESSLKQGLLWAGSDDGLIHVTSDDGGTWNDVTPDVVKGRYVSAIAVSRHAEQTVYAAIDGHRTHDLTPTILLTEDLGKTWSDISGNLPGDWTVRIVIEDMDNPEVLYAGTESGVFVTLDRGGNWVRLNGKLPPVRIDDMVMHPREKDIVLGTHGRSVWVLDDASMFSQLTPESRSSALAFLESPPAHPRLYSGQHYGQGHGLFRAKNPTMGAAINYWVNDDPNETVRIRITDQSDFVVRELTGPSRTGLNRVIWDLQTDAKHRFPASDNEGWLGQTEFVPAGTYKVALSMGDHKSKGSIQVLPSPTEPED